MRTTCHVACSLAGVIGTCWASIAASLPAELTIYDWRCRISGSLETGRIYKARLPLDVYDGFRSFPLDMQVVDAKGNTWPAMIWSRPDRSGMVPVRSTELDRTSTATNAAFAMKEFLIEPTHDGTIPVHNRVIVQSGTGEYVRRAEVWGGSKPSSLVMLGSGFLIEQKSPDSIRNRSIDYPDSQWPLVVVRVFHDTSNQRDTMDWRTTEVVYVENDDTDHEKITLKAMDPPPGETSPTGIHSLYFDAGAQNRALLYAIFESQASDAAIPVRAFGRNATTNGWRWIADGGLHHLEGHKQNRFMLSRSDYRYLKLEFIHNQQAPPVIKNIEAWALPHYVLFEVQSSEKAYLFFGSPRYDLELSYLSRRIDPEKIIEEDLARLSRPHTNPLRVASSLTNYGRTLLRLGIGVVVLLVAIVSVRIIRHRYMH